MTQIIQHMQQTQEHKNWVEESFADVHKDLNIPKNTPTPFFFEILENNKRIAAASGEIMREWCNLTSLSVIKTHQNKGLGKKLLTAVENYAKEQQAIGITLSTTSYYAPQFYRDAGYQEFAVIKPYAGENKKYYMKKVF